MAIIINVHSRLKFSKIIEKEKETTTALDTYIAKNVTLFGLNVGFIAPNHGEESEEAFSESITDLASPTNGRRPYPISLVDMQNE